MKAEKLIINEKLFWILKSNINEGIFEYLQNEKSINNIISDEPDINSMEWIKMINIFL